MTVFYQGPTLRITQGVIESLGQSVPIHDLHAVRVVRTPGQLSLRAWLARTAGVAAAVLAVVLSLARYTALGSLPIAVITAAVVALGVALIRARAPMYAVVGSYQGRDLTLFETRDELEFGKVRRALQRALEQDHALD